VVSEGLQWCSPQKVTFGEKMGAPQLTWVRGCSVARHRVGPRVTTRQGSGWRLSERSRRAGVVNTFGAHFFPFNVTLLIQAQFLHHSTSRRQSHILTKYAMLLTSSQVSLILSSTIGTRFTVHLKRCELTRPSLHIHIPPVSIWIHRPTADSKQPTNSNKTTRSHPTPPTPCAREPNSSQQPCLAIDSHVWQLQRPSKDTSASNCTRSAL
jgi:hypothetical protein